MRGENFEAEKGAEKPLRRGTGYVFGSSPKRLEQPHPELVHWWLLVHSSPSIAPMDGQYVTHFFFGRPWVNRYLNWYHDKY